MIWNDRVKGDCLPVRGVVALLSLGQLVEVAEKAGLFDDESR